MLVESALGLQAEIFRKIFQFEELPVAAAGSSGVFPTLVDPYLMDDSLAEMRVRKSARRRPYEDIALGVAEGPRNEEAQLAILIQNHLLMNSDIIDSIKDVAKQEVDVSYIGRQVPLWTKGRNQPLRLGCSTSPTSVQYSGTLGCFCQDSHAQGVNLAIGILSNNHVLANVNQVAIGTSIIQQAGGDAGHPVNDAIGNLTRFVPIQFGGVPNAVDAAFALLINHNRGVDTVGIYDSKSPPTKVMTLQPSGVSLPFPGMPVYKTGRTTRYTSGRVRAINVNNYAVSMGGLGIARFDGQIIFEMANNPPAPFSAPGDSGSLIVDGNGIPVALLFAGSQSGGAGNLGITAGNPISLVKAQLGINLI